MRLATSGRPPASDDVAAAVSGAVALLGQRPAITGHLRDGRGDGGPGPSGGRREQGYASLAGWIAKGANLLHGELGLSAGDRLGLAGPPGWPLAAVTLSAWWLGVTVVPWVDLADPNGHPADVVVAHHVIASRHDGGSTAADRTRTLLTFGDAIDGTTATPEATPAAFEEWTDAVTPHGDRPPAPAHDGDLVALVTTDGVEHTQRMLLARAVSGAEGGSGVLGMLRHGDEDLLTRPDAADRFAALALRPLVSGSATVIIEVDDPSRDALSRAERVARWLD